MVSWLAALLLVVEGPLLSHLELEHPTALLLDKSEAPLDASLVLPGEGVDASTGELADARKVPVVGGRG